MARMSSLPLLLIVLATMSTGCQSPYHADQGALLGGLLGAGTGAVVGSAVGHPGAGAALGAGVGAISGAAIGSAQDEMEAKNRAMIAQQLGRQVAAGAVTPNEVIAMTRAGVNEELIVNHIRAHGTAAQLQSQDLINLQQQGISARVVATMQACPPQPPVMVQEAAPPPVVVEGYPYGYYGPPPRPYAHVYYRWR
jgi:hypothetical protein